MVDNGGILCSRRVDGRTTLTHAPGTLIFRQDIRGGAGVDVCGGGGRDVLILRKIWLPSPSLLHPSLSSKFFPR